MDNYYCFLQLHVQPAVIGLQFPGLSWGVHQCLKAEPSAAHVACIQPAMPTSFNPPSHLRSSDARFSRSPSSPLHPIYPNAEAATDASAATSPGHSSTLGIRPCKLSEKVVPSWPREIRTDPTGRPRPRPRLRNRLFVQIPVPRALGSCLPPSCCCCLVHSTSKVLVSSRCLTRPIQRPGIQKGRHPTSTRQTAIDLTLTRPGKHRNPDLSGALVHTGHHTLTSPKPLSFSLRIISSHNAFTTSAPKSSPDHRFTIVLCVLPAGSLPQTLASCVHCGLWD